MSCISIMQAIRELVDSLCTRPARVVRPVRLWPHQFFLRETENRELTSRHYTQLTRFLPVVVGKAYEHHIGKALHSAAYL